MRLIVTGALGFVGSNVTRHLARAGHEVVAVGRRAPDAWVLDLLGDARQQVQFRSADLALRGDLARALASDAADAVVHAAVITATTAQVERDAAREIVDVNVGGTIEALEWAREHGCRRFVYVSSPSAIGMVAGGTLLDETVVPDPETLYGITKLTSEQMTRRYRRLHALSAASVRIAQPYGPGERPTPSRARTSPMCEWLQAALDGETLISGPLDVGRDWTWVEETARGIAELALAPQLGHDLYHLGCGEVHTVGAVIAALRERFPDLHLDDSPDAPGLNPNIAGRGSRPPLVCERFRTEFGWQPSVGIEEGMRRYLDSSAVRPR